MLVVELVGETHRVEGRRRVHGRDRAAQPQRDRHAAAHAHHAVEQREARARLGRDVAGVQFGLKGTNCVIIIMSSHTRLPRVVSDQTFVKSANICFGVLKVFIHMIVCVRSRAYDTIVSIALRPIGTGTVQLVLSYTSEPARLRLEVFEVPGIALLNYSYKF